jgi:alkylated DNA repair dioxygenase AlkB
MGRKPTYAANARRHLHDDEASNVRQHVVMKTDSPNPAFDFDALLLSDSQALFRQLVQDVDWDERMKARKTASYGVSYDYSQMTYAARPMLPSLQAVADRVASRVGFAPNNCLLNYYEDGSASMGFHSDSAEELAPGTGVAIVSLGGEREIVFRSKAHRSREHRLLLPSGSLLYMPPSSQEDWLHAIPKAEGAEPRISLTFRLILK